MSSKRRSRGGHVLTIGLAAAALAATTVAVTVSIPFSTSAMVEPATADELRVLLTQLGIEPEAAAAAGLSPQQVSAAVAALRDHLDGAIGPLRDAESALAAARRDRDALARLVRSGTATPEQQALLAQAESALAAAESGYQARIGAARAAATEGLSEPQRTALERIRSGRARELPVQYLLTERTDGEWVALRDALSGRKTAQRYGEELAHEAAQVLLAADSEPATALASANLQIGLAEVRSAFEAALAP